MWGTCAWACHTHTHGSSGDLGQEPTRPIPRGATRQPLVGRKRPGSIHLSVHSTPVKRSLRAGVHQAHPKGSDTPTFGGTEAPGLDPPFRNHSTRLGRVFDGESLTETRPNRRFYPKPPYVRGSIHQSLYSRPRRALLSQIKGKHTRNK